MFLEPNKVITQFSSIIWLSLTYCMTRLQMEMLEEVVTR